MTTVPTSTKDVFLTSDFVETLHRHYLFVRYEKMTSGKCLSGLNRKHIFDVTQVFLKEQNTMNHTCSCKACVPEEVKFVLV